MNKAATRFHAGYALLAVSLLAVIPAHGAQLTIKVTGKDGQPLANAVVYASGGPGRPLPAPKNAEIDQVNKTFAPQVTVVQTGAAVSFPNSDNIRHQVYSFSPAKVFNTKLYSGRPAAPVVFDKPGIVVLGCNIHDRMVAWVVVVDTPWFARADDSGRAVITELPAGDYVLTFWHAALHGEPVTRPLKLTAEASLEEAIQLDAVAPADAHAGHGARS